MRYSYYILSAFVLMFVSCTSVKNVPFSANNFHVSPKTGYVQNADSTLRFTFCADIIDPNMLIVDSEQDAAQYNNLHNYLNTICSQLQVRCDSILFYSPSYDKLLVEISEPITWKPRSQTVNMTDENPYTMWVRDDDNEDWHRKPVELYSNVLLSKKQKQILVVDRFNYGNRNVALVHIIQSPTKQFLKIGLPQWTESWVDVNDPTCLEPIANWIDGHRKVAIANYKLGME